jgi:putative DNA modification/repair radical SAM protein
VARVLREEHDFRGYIHLKTIPDASEELLKRAGRYADRLSINVELPTEQGLQSLAPEKDGVAIRRSMGRLKTHIDDAKEARKSAAAKPIRVIPGAATRPAKPPRFAPAGQSTQMIVGADGSDDRSILRSSALLYNSFRMRRVYYSAFSPIPDASRALPLQSPPLVREHRLYQADWLMRFYGFGHEEIVDDGSGLLRLDVDPKLAWALAHPERFPVDLNTAPKELLLRVPGLGVESVGKVLQSRRLRRIRAEDLQQMKVAVRKVLPFVEVDGHRPRREVGEYLLRQWMAPKTADRGARAVGMGPAPGSGTLFGANGEVLLLDTPTATPAMSPTANTGEAMGLPLTRERDSLITPAPAAVPATPVQLGLFA